jgi:hypothetical protein
MKNGMFDVSQVLVSCLVLSGRMSFLYELDKALQQATREDIFPDWVRTQLHFSDARTGLKCVELSEITSLAESAGLIAGVAPDYKTAEICILSNTARRLMKKLTVDEESAKNWGRLLSDFI